MEQKFRCQVESKSSRRTWTGDGDVDLISVGSLEVAWYENLGGLAYGSATVLASAESPQTNPPPIRQVLVPESIVDDFDQDGDPDVIVLYAAADSMSRTSEVFENREGTFVSTGQFGRGDHQLLRSFGVVDLDGDGDLDVVGDSGFVDGLSFFENLDGINFEDPQLLSNTEELRTNYALQPVTMADFDGDGLADIAGIHRATVQWHRNALESAGPLVTPIDIDRIHRELRGEGSDERNDWNDDGSVSPADVDFLLAEELDTVRADINLDGQVDFVDFAILAGEFGKQNALWADGDINGDGSVDFKDFLTLSASFDSN